MIDFIIIGSGFAGIGMGIRLKQEHRSFVILEKADSVGGTWRENTYPGCACDVASHLYSFSFEQNPRWSRWFAEQPEIRAYLEHCTDKYDLRGNLRFGREVVSARFDETMRVWRVETASKETFIARHLVFGIGALHRPAYPSIPGLETFKGKTFHSARWDHDYPLEGKRVAVIGTGASSIQFVPHLAQSAQALTLFQRTPAWVLPKPDAPITDAIKQRFADKPWLQRLARYGIFGIMETFTAGFTLAPRLLRLAERVGRAHIRKQIKDPELAAKVTPNYRAGCKRILMSNDYYPALARPNVAVVTDAITKVTETGVVTADGKTHAVDAIVYGTGFQVTELLTPLQVLGRNGVNLNDEWANGAQAHLGTTLAGFPNAFMILGPNVGLSSNSMVFMIEAQIDHIMACVQAAEQRGAVTIEVRKNAQSEFNQRLQKRLKDTIWSSGCQSWYLDAHGRNTTIWPGLTLEYWARTRKVSAASYLFDTTVAAATTRQARAS